MALLEVSDLSARYGAFQALFGISLAVDEGAVVAVIGANGAGKSTLLGAISGSVATTTGSIVYDGKELRGTSTHARVADGISLVPEGRRLFPSLSVDENLDVGGYRRRPGPWTKAKVYAAFPMLAPLARRSAARLSGGEAQAVAIGRALMNNPRLLLLDEVSLGLAPIVVQQLYTALATIAREGTTMLLVEQDINQALKVSSHAYCFLEGRVSLSGRSEELDRADVTAAYFGLEQGAR